MFGEPQLALGRVESLFNVLREKLRTNLIISLAFLFSAEEWTIVTMAMGITLQMSLLMRNLKFLMLMRVRFLV